MVTKELVFREFEELCGTYKKLLPPEVYGGGWKIDGEFDVMDADGHRWDTYEIRIVIPPGFPYELPKLIETSKKIGQTPDWHNSDGECCLATHAKIFNELGTPLSLLKWMDRFVHDYLASHVIRIREKIYPKGEYPHGEEGMVVGYKEIFNLDTDEEVLERLNFLCGTTSLGRNDRCFCQSGRKYKHCFLMNPMGHFANIPIELLNKERIKITDWLKKNVELTRL